MHLIYCWTQEFPLVTFVWGALRYLKVTLFFHTAVFSSKPLEQLI